MHHLKTLALACTLALLPSAWADRPDSPPPPAAVTAPAVAWAPELAQVHGVPVEYAAHRAPQARATVVFENGLMLTLDTWRAVATALADCCNWLAYNRAGVGRSALPEEAQEPAQAAARLRRLLQDRELPPPYIVVGHSLGGQYAQLFARQYPGQVRGLLLVDALPLGTVKPAADFPWFTRLGLWLLAPAAARREIAGIHAMGEQLLTQPNRYAGPMVRLVALPDPRAGKSKGLVRDLFSGVIYAENFGVWAVDPDRAERSMDGLYPQAEVHRLQAHHRMPEQMPQGVVDAIRKLIARSEDGVAAGSGPPSEPVRVQGAGL